jgi:UDP-N-acetylmuramate dehydrogenase
MPELDDRSFGARTTLRVGGNARRIFDVADVDELASIADLMAADEPVYILGRGSNTLVADAGFAGTVVHLGEGFSSISFHDEADRVLVTAGGSVDLPVLARRCAHEGIAGFTWAVGVPGSVGGAVRMNAGGHGSDMNASVVSATIFDLVTKRLVVKDREALAFRYRHSSIQATEVVVEVTLQLKRGDRETEQAALSTIVQWRRAHQPGGANCGSVFTNPPEVSAGQLIDQAGLKGHRHGSAQVSPKHANFIQADVGGKGDDVAALIEQVADAVELATGVRLSTEVQMVGFEEQVDG